MLIQLIPVVPPAALAQVAVVEGQDAEPGLVEPPGEQVGARLLGHREAAGHDHAGAVAPRVVPGRALGAAAGEPDLLPFHGCPRLDVQRNASSAEVNHLVRRMSIKLRLGAKGARTCPWIM